MDVGLEIIVTSTAVLSFCYDFRALLLLEQCLLCTDVISSEMPFFLQAIIFYLEVIAMSY